MIINVMALEPPAQWWTEHDFVLEGTPCTSYMNWPRDRLIHFYREPDQSVEVKSRQGEMSLICEMDLICEGRSMLVPTFLAKDDAELNKHMRSALRDTAKNFKSSRHLHLIKVQGLRQFAIIIGDKKLTPVTDCWLKESEND